MALGNVRGSRRNVKEIFLGRFHILDKTVSPALVEMLDPARKHLRNRTFPFGRSDRHVFRPDLLPTAFFGQGIGYPPVFVDIGDHLLERTGTAGLPFLPPLLFKGDNETYIEGPTGNDDIILYDNQMRDRPRTRRTKRNV